MRRMVGLTALLMCVVMLFGLVACGKPSSGSDGSVLQSSSSETLPSQSTTVPTTSSTAPTTTNPTTNTTVPQNCNHVWGMWTQKTAATCTKEGQQVSKCLSCGQEQSKAIQSLAHQESDWVIDQVAQVGAPGKKHTRCVHCGKEMRTQEIPALPEIHVHSGKSWVTVQAPDCLNSGSRELRCDCGLVMQAETIAPTGHSEVQIPAVSPTCTVPGLTEGYCCQVCKTVTIQQWTVGALGHNMIQSVKEPTENEDGYTLHSCTRCT